MNKIQFLLALSDKLSAYPKDEVEERLRFYSEMIEDRMEEGLSEEEAVCAVGTVEEIAAQIAADMPPVTKKARPERELQLWQILLLALGAPLWLPLVIAAFAVAVSAYASLWAVVVSLWAAFAGVAGSAIGCLAGGVVLICGGKQLAGIAVVGAALVCAGVAILLCWGSLAATKGSVLLAKKTVDWIRACFAGRGRKE